ncbi:restriction endonuclease subunit S [Bifidobacterium bifidum]|uniref:restriction endonuclease subunit S n=1 Tax=Bifidobacterium bifidum TaxID=1681 RepID=UPI001AEC35D8|nr:restriction endonuclease subunit S [Bifidobacterium bifidum]QTQ18763.1 putative type I restriction-modification system specificity subunit [Bifidobacterium bifidum]
MSWRETTLGEITDLKRGFDLPKSQRLQGDVPVYSSSGITGSNSTAAVEGPCVITGRYGTIGEVFFSGGPCWPLNTALYSTEFNGNNPRFIYYLLQTIPWQGYTTASAVPGVNRNHVNLCPVKIPDRATQDAIVEVLDSIVDKIALNNRLNDYLEQLCQSLFDRFDNDENNLFVKVSDIADVNPRRTLKKGEEALCVEMADLSTTGAFPTDWRTKAYNGGVKFVNGDTILARITPCLENGKAGYINFLEQDEVAFGSTEYIVLTSKGELPSEFFYFLARNEDFISYATAHMNGSSGRQRVSGADVGNYEVRMPSEKQVSEFKEIAGKAMRVISASSIESRKLAQSRDALLPKLMSGEIDVSKVDLTQPTNNHLAGC